MDFDIPKRSRPHLEKYSKEEISIAKKFSSGVKKEMGSFVRSIVLFGSTARKTANKHSDIDMLLIIDDLNVVITRDVSEGSCSGNPVRAQARACSQHRALFLQLR